MSATNQGRMELDMRVHLIDAAAVLHDLRGRKAEFPFVYHNDNYAAGQHLAVTLRKDGSSSIAYDSLRCLSESGSRRSHQGRGMASLRSMNSEGVRTSMPRMALGASR